MCEMMSKGSKEALTVLIVTDVKGVKSGVCSFNVTHLTHVRRVKSVLYSV